MIRVKMTVVLAFVCLSACNKHSSKSPQAVVPQDQNNLELSKRKLVKVDQETTYDIRILPSGYTVKSQLASESAELNFDVLATRKDKLNGGIKLPQTPAIPLLICGKTRLIRKDNRIYFRDESSVETAIGEYLHVIGPNSTSFTDEEFEKWSHPLICEGQYSQVCRLRLVLGEASQSFLKYEPTIMIQINDRDIKIASRYPEKLNPRFSLTKCQEN